MAFQDTPHTCTTPEQALAAVRTLHHQSMTRLREAFRTFAAGGSLPGRVSAPYPEVRLTVSHRPRQDSRLSYGFVDRPGTYATTLTRPDLFHRYYLEQFRLLMENHQQPLQVGPGDQPMPLHFALGEEFHLEGDLGPAQMASLPAWFDQPDLDALDDSIANGDVTPGPDGAMPLALFSAPRVDISLQRLKHYTGTRPEHFQNYVIFTNYQFYIDEFVKIAHGLMQASPTPAQGMRDQHYDAFVEPGDRVTVNATDPGPFAAEAGRPLARLPQMPAYHLKRADGAGLTMINIGVGPSNAKTITDHLAVLRPHAWLMLGHCAGLRSSQHLGDYVLAHGYLREDHILDQDLPPTIPLPALAEIQVALEQAVGEITGLTGYELKHIMRTGTVATIDDRNWEFQPAIRQNRRLSQSRATALDMESGTIAANGFRFRVPYGTLLCVSDKPLHGQLKLPGMADRFYRERVDQHLHIGLLAMALLREIGPEKLHSRKLRSFNEVAFQ